MEENITVTQALVELKLLDDKIHKAINGGTYIAVKTRAVAQSEEELTKTIKASWQKTTALIARREAIKNALVLSNATNDVTVEGRTYTVAEAIELKKHGMAYKRELLRKMIEQTKTANRTYEKAVNEVESNALSLAKTAVGTADADVLKATAAYKDYIENNPIKQIDPININDVMQKMADAIDDFLANVDVALALANSRNTITISYDTE